MIRTERLVLRPPVSADRPALVALLSDPQVMAELMSGADEASANDAIGRHMGWRDSDGLGFWVVTHQDCFAGFVGLKPGAPGTPIEGTLEIGWIMATAFHGQGIAREAAEASLAWAWANTDAPEVVAITAAINQRSQKLMARLGMARDPHGDFDHHRFGDGDPLKPTVTYRIARP